jgi:hypothetical protein
LYQRGSVSLLPENIGETPQPHKAGNVFLMHPHITPKRINPQKKKYTIILKT